PLTKVFWKGEFEGKNLFFKKGFPLLIKLEKTSLKGSQLAGDRKFFQASEARQIVSHAQVGPIRGRVARRILPAPLKTIYVAEYLSGSRT
ncbi:MAG: hypothetical protein IJF84_04805, partial [Thermoguttaceae bacterium]|nr:hypothetical protein [Thermoguttaceae bacterium]